MSAEVKNGGVNLEVQIRVEGRKIRVCQDGKILCEGFFSKLTDEKLSRLVVEHILQSFIDIIKFDTLQGNGCEN